MAPESVTGYECEYVRKDHQWMDVMQRSLMRCVRVSVECGHHLILGYRLEIPLVSLVSVECGPDL